MLGVLMVATTVQQKAEGLGVACFKTCPQCSKAQQFSPRNHAHLEFQSFCGTLTDLHWHGRPMPLGSKKPYKISLTNHQLPAGQNPGTQ